MQGEVRDGETYLREKGEELLLGGHNDPRGFNRLPRIARVLEVAGALDGPVAARVLDEYATAFRLRREGRFWVPPQPGVVATPLPRSRVVAGPWVIKDKQASIVVDQVRFALDRFSFEAHGSIAHGRRSAGSRARRHQSPAPSSFTVVDSAGTTVAAASSAGGWGDHEWHSTFESSAPLDPDTPWIEIAGQRLELPATPATTTKAWVEDLPTDEDPVRAELWWSLTIDATEPFIPESNELDAAVEALLATGVLHPDDPTLSDARAIRSAVLQSGGRAASTGRRGSLPPPWSAWQRRQTRRDGPVGQLPIGANLDDVEGCNLRIDTLQSNEDGFSLQLAASPGAVIMSRTMFRRQLIFWAEDERGNAYLGVPGHRGGSSSGETHGQVDFTGPLDPDARLLRVLPTGRRRRGVVEIPLEGLVGDR